MGVGAGLYMCDVVVKSSRSLSHLLMSSCSIYVRAKLISLGSVCVYIVIVAVNHVSCFVVVKNAEY